MKIAVIHDWLVTYAGAEKVLEEILNIYPEADLYSLIDFLPTWQRTFLKNRKVRTSFIQHLPLAKKKYRIFLPLMPSAIEQFDLSHHSLIISSSHAIAKGVRTDSSQLHICYCHTPMRYAWDFQHQYLKEANFDRGLKGLLIKIIMNRIRVWDQVTATKVNHFVANSQYIAGRIRRIYNKEASVIYPPVETDNFIIGSNRENFYLTASRLVPYKKIGLVVEAFSRMPDKKLIVVGDGPDFEKINSQAERNIELLGYQPFAVLRDYMQKAKAFVFAAEEDFGIVPVEAQACGTPVIAYGKGGILETIIENKTGIFFKEQSPESLIEAVQEFEKRQDNFDSLEIRRNAERFSKERFKTEFKEFVDRKVKEFFTINTAKHLSNMEGFKDTIQL